MKLSRLPEYARSPYGEVKELELDIVVNSAKCRYVRCHAILKATQRQHHFRLHARMFADCVDNKDINSAWFSSSRSDYDLDIATPFTLDGQMRLKEDVVVTGL